MATIYTDASWCPNSGLVGWGAWLKYGKTPGIKLSGMICQRYPSSNEAELAAVGMALYETGKLGVLTSPDSVIIVTDSQYAMDAINKRNPSAMKGKSLEIVRWIDEFLLTNGWSIKANKVKGHSRHDGTRSTVNRLVDDLARSALSRARTSAARPHA